MAMTEVRWHRSKRPVELFAFLADLALVSDRKWRLFAAACHRRLAEVPSPLAAERLAAVEVAERFADGRASAEELAARYHPTRWSVAGAEAVRTAMLFAQSPSEPPTKAIKADLFRDLFANPFRPMTFKAAWRTPAVVSLAQAAYDERLPPRSDLDGVRLAILADALEEGGCADAAILAHLRSPGPHVRGCWAVNLCLNRN